MGVASIVLEYGGDETLAVAALLHDAIEDQGGESTGSVIERIFGLEVADLVRACSEDKSKPWMESKRGYVDAIAREGSGPRLICAADKLHNVRTILTYHRIRGEEVWERFRGGRDKSLWFYEAVLGALRSAANDTDPPQLAYLVDELGHTLLELQSLAASSVR
jgi:(p)ppGpp synthase/HD superfamily hydrolase